MASRNREIKRGLPGDEPDDDASDENVAALDDPAAVENAENGAEASAAASTRSAPNGAHETAGKPSLSEQFNRFGHGKSRAEALRIALGNETANRGHSPG